MAVQDASLGFDCVWDFENALKHVANLGGIYTFQFGFLVRVKDAPVNTLIDLHVERYVNGVLTDTYIKELNPSQYNLDRYYHFGQSFELNESQEVDFKFRLSRPTIGLPNPSFTFCFDAFQLVFEKINSGFGMPSPYTLPLYTQTHGTYDYANSLPSQSFTGTALKINNNGGGANTNLDFKFSAIPNIFNTTTNFLEFDALELGDKVDVRADLTITTTTANQDVDIYLDVALGTASNYQIFLCRRNFKTAGTYSVNDISNWLYIGNTDTKDYNCALMFDSDANATVLNNGMVINVIKRLA